MLEKITIDTLFWFCYMTVFSIEISHGRGSLYIKSLHSDTQTPLMVAITFSYTFKSKIHQIQLRRQYFFLIFRFFHQCWIPFHSMYIMNRKRKCRKMQ